jgi:hypothetical protein
MVVLPISLAMIFIVLYATLGSARASLLILVNIPFALVGGMVSLAVSGDYLSVPASVGFIALLGIAVLNGLVMVSYIRQLREGGMALARAVREGAAASAPGADDCDDCRFRSGAAAVRHGAGIGNPEAAGHCGHWRAGQLDPAHADPAAHPLREIRRESARGRRDGDGRCVSLPVIWAWRWC